MADIFFSYSREDLDRILPIVHALESTGYTIFWDRNIPAGRSWREVISGELHAAQCVMVAWSDNSIKSRFVIEEAEVSSKQNALVPVLIDKVEPPFGFGSIQAADLTDWHGALTDAAFQKLVHDIGERIGPPATRSHGLQDGEIHLARQGETDQQERRLDNASTGTTPKRRRRISRGKIVAISIALIIMIIAVSLIVYSRSQVTRPRVEKKIPSKTLVKPNIELQPSTVIKK